MCIVKKNQGSPCAIFYMQCVHWHIQIFSFSGFILNIYMYIFIYQNILFILLK